MSSRRMGWTMRSGEYDLIAPAAVGEQMTWDRSTPYGSGAQSSRRIGYREHRYESLSRHGSKERCTGIANPMR